LKGGPKIRDEGLSVLQTKVAGDEPPKLLKTRNGKVGKALLAVADMVDSNQAVLFDSGGSYAYNKKSGELTPFVRSDRGWEISFDLEAPEKANQVRGAWKNKVKDFKPEISLSAMFAQSETPEVANEPDINHFFRLASPS
jgi:hypothetical protein